MQINWVKVVDTISAILAVVSVGLLFFGLQQQSSLTFYSWVVFTSGTAAVLAVFNSLYKRGKFYFSWLRIIRVAMLGLSMAIFTILSLNQYIPAIPPAINVAIGGIAGFLVMLWTSQTWLAT